LLVRCEVSQIPIMTFEEAAEGLRHGDFSRLGPLFGDPDRPNEADGQIMAWLDAGAFANAPDVLNEALTCACWLGMVGVARRLLDAGADPAAGNATGLSALHWAANRGQVPAVRLLLAAGAPMEQRNMYDGTALDAAVWSAVNEPRGDQRGAIVALLDAGADPAAVEFPTGSSEIDKLLARYL